MQKSEIKRLIKYQAKLFGLKVDEVTSIFNYLDFQKGTSTSTIIDILQTNLMDYCKNRDNENMTRVIEAKARFDGVIAGIGDKEAYKDFVQQVEDDVLEKYGINMGLTILDSAGRKWPFSTFVRREFKTRIINNMLDNVLNDAAEFGHNLMIVSHNMTASPLCINRQNKIYWTIYQEEDYTQLDPELWKNGGGLFHPNCRHTINAYFPGESLPPVKERLSKSQQEALYKQSQKQAYIKRNKKKYYDRKERARLLNNKEAYEHNMKYWRKWNAIEKEL